MKSILKRVNSCLLALAIVLPMIPALRLPVQAVDVVPSTGERFPTDVTSYEANCPVCEKVVTWNAYNGENYSDSNPLTASATATHFHLYLTQDQVFDAGKYFLVCYRSACLNLNGFDVTASEGSMAAFAVARKFNVIDTYGGSVVTGYRNSATTGAAINANSTNNDKLPPQKSEANNKKATPNVNKAGSVCTNFNDSGYFL